MAKMVVFNLGSPILIMSAMISTDRVMTEISDKERSMPWASKISLRAYTPQLSTLRFGDFSHWVIWAILSAVKTVLVSMIKDCFASLAMTPKELLFVLTLGDRFNSNRSLGLS